MGGCLDQDIMIHGKPLGQIKDKQNMFGLNWIVLSLVRELLLIMNV